MNTMQQIEFFEIGNPCIGVCESGPRGYCKGCLRSREERKYWNQLDDFTKHQIVQACAIRKQRIAKAKQEPSNTMGSEHTTQQDDLFLNALPLSETLGSSQQAAQDAPEGRPEQQALATKDTAAPNNPIEEQNELF